MPELDKTLAQLAEKFGTTVGHLWQVLIHQARIELWSDALFFLLTFGTVYACKIWWVSIEKRHPGDVVYGAHPGEFVPLVIFSGVTLTFVICAVITMFEVPTLLLNPEYWALKQVLGR